VKFGLRRTIYWAEAGVIKFSAEDGADVTVLAGGHGNVTAIDISSGNVTACSYLINILPYSPEAAHHRQIFVKTQI